MDMVLLLVAIPAVMIVGISKGGFGGGLGLLAVPLMSLVVSPTVAAGIMLPILCAMDLFAVWAWRKRLVWSHLLLLVPTATVGIVIGTLTFGVFDEHALKVLLGVLSIGFTVHWAWKTVLQNKEVSLSPALRRPVGVMCGTIAGFTSFIAHAGGPPLNMYLIPLKLSKEVFQATTVFFYFSVNLIKLPPYAMLDLFGDGNWLVSLILMPLAPLGVWLGIRLHHKVNERFFYILCHFFLFLTGLKLIWDGVILSL